MKAVALFSDTCMLPGLHVTLATLLKTLGDDERGGMVVHLFLDRVRPKERNLLAATHGRHARGVGLRLHDFSPAAPPGGNALHGNQTTYGRLYLPELLGDCDRCVYLDSDLVVNRSVGELFDQFDSGSVLTVDGAGRRAASLDRELFVAAGLDMRGACFNAGVMGINLELWRRREGTRTCEAIARKHQGLFRSADQALLNTVFHDSFRSVGDMWNSVLPPAAPRVWRPEARIYHFVGSPKPWDFLGRCLVNNYKLWEEHYRDTALGGSSYLKYAGIKRSVLTSRQVLRAWKSRQRRPEA